MRRFRIWCMATKALSMSVRPSKRDTSRRRTACPLCTKVIEPVRRSRAVPARADSAPFTFVRRSVRAPRLEQECQSRAIDTDGGQDGQAIRDRDRRPLQRKGEHDKEGREPKRTDNDSAQNALR